MLLVDDPNLICSNLVIYSELFLDGQPPNNRLGDIIMFGKLLASRLIIEVFTGNLFF